MKNEIYGKMLTLKILLLAIIIFAKEINGHGMMLEPPNRSSLWRFDPTAPINYNDNQNFCGGYVEQWVESSGKCGVCGDKYSDIHPQSNENTGLYGQGKVVRKYNSGSVIDIDILLTANHRGFFTYSLCVLKDANRPEEGENCFQPLNFYDGKEKYLVSDTDYLINNKIKLPNNLTCERCVLRWHYTAGNNWGDCANGTSAVGCGPQETFRSCSDIQII